MGFRGPRKTGRPRKIGRPRAARRSKSWIRPLIFAVFIAAAGYSVLDSRQSPAPGGGVSDDALVASAYENQQSDLQVQGEGVVLRILPDDTRGSRHQKFLLKLASGQTLLVAHNIDIAPRIPQLQEGDVVAFRGEYEWNERGGVVHWTHKANDGNHRSGWLRHRGITYD